MIGIIEYKYLDKYNKDIEDFLKSKNIDLKEEKEYLKYGLIEVCEYEDILLNTMPLYIKKNFDALSFYIIPDENIGKFMCIVKKAMENGEIKTLAIRPEECRSIFDECRTLSYEALEYGKEFDPMLLEESTEKYFVSKFYDDNYYKDSLWIKIDTNKKEMTFEEIIPSKEEFFEFKVTQVIHLKYFFEDDNCYIKHIDHEFISYTPDEYDKRMSKIEIKGIKTKTIKIDDSKIPFVKKGRIQPFLIYFLECFFIKDKLIEEYFKKDKTK